MKETKLRKRSDKRRVRRKRQMLFEGLESRQLLNADTGSVTVPSTVDPNLFAAQLPRNIGTVPAFQFFESEGTAIGLNDSYISAEVVPLGTGPDQEDTIDVLGSMTFDISGSGFTTTDLDTFAVDLRAGDILDIAVQGSGSNFTVQNANGAIWFGTDLNQSSVGFYPPASPLMTVGNAIGAQVVPEDGRYYITVAPTFGSGNYTLGLRAYRPVLEQLPIGSQQVVYLDFDGGLFPNSILPGDPQTGVVRFLGITDSLNQIGIQQPTQADVDLIIDYVVEEVEQQMHSIATNGTNGDFDATGNPGDYGITVLNSRDHVDPGLNNPLVTRVMLGSEVGATIQGIYGISPSLDVGNFDPSEIVQGFIEAHITGALQFPLDATAPLIDAISQQLAGTTTHELAHSFGIFHTDGSNFLDTISDEGGARLDTYLQGVGNDGVFGSNDDIVPEFRDDRFSTAENLFFGVQHVPAALSHVLSTGTVGTSLTGRVFNDVNRNGNGTGEAGLAGVTVFADIIQNGFIDPTEPVAVTNANGVYSLTVAPGAQYNIIAQTPNQYSATIPTVRFASGGDTGVDFGFYKVDADATGTVFADTNGNRLREDGEGGVAGVFVYLDLDGDRRPDLGEPSAITNANGQYSINFPGPGTYTIEAVVEPGFELTTPTSQFHTVVYTGGVLPDNYDFGFLPSRDYGDAPDSYQTSVAAGGPSHGINTGFGLGAQVDREVNGFPTDNALGDDNNNIDDEDGVQLMSPLGPGGTATLRVTTRNTFGDPGYLQGWIDFNRNGTFDSSEKVFSDLIVQAGTTDLQVSVPASASVGSTFARFRYSPTPGLGVGGAADVGEVEDYQFDILRQAAVANDDEFTVSRNSLSNLLDVLANDFETSVTQLTITQLNTTGTQGSVGIISGGRAISYTPPNGFTGRDVFQYVVRDQNNNTYTASVVVNVNFRSNVPLAVDDTFDIPQGSTDRALNVLDNDVPSIFGGLRITSVTAGDQGGQVTLEGGGQTIRYTPQPGFAGTEQFTYSIEDAQGSVSTAEVTVNSQPGARNDDRIDFSIGIFDTLDNRELSSVQVGQTFQVKVFVQELNNAPFLDAGVASAFLDLLYTDELVSTTDTIDNDSFPFDISFGDIFQGSGFTLGDATIPGLINDVGAVQPIPSDGNLTQHTDPVELFTLTMTAVSPGIAVFGADPADAPEAETILIGEDTALTPAQQRLGTAELTIFPASDNFASAVDDAFMQGTDSAGRVISSGNAPNTLDVLANDNFGPTGTLREFGIVTSPSLGTVTINDNGTPADVSDDTIEYFANVNASGYDSFTYLIVSDEGVRSIAEVTMAIGNAAADDLVEMSFGLVDQFGSPITSVASGQTFGVQVYVEDLRSSLEGNTFVFAAYMDMLYDSGLISPVDVAAGGRYDFDVDFDSDFDENAGVGTAARNGIIDEFGSLLRQSVAQGGSVVEPNLMATVYFTAANVAQTTTTQVKASPADASPFQDTLLFDRDDPVPVSQITYDALNITITAGSSLQNPALPEDVNNDGIVTPSDALNVINMLARGGSGESAGKVYYTDVNGDSKTTPVDALRVINHLALAAAARQAEGEAAGNVALLATTPAEGESAARAEAFADLNQDDKLVSGDSAGGAYSAAAIGSLSESVGDDDEDDLLSLLADDQSSLA